VAAVYFRRKQGNEDNQYIGLVWGLALLGAVGYRVARRDATSHAAVALLIVAIAGAAVVGRSVDERVPPIVPATATWIEVEPELRAYARDHVVYVPEAPYLNVRPQKVVYPEYFNILDLLAAGRQPEYLVNALLDRRFDAVATFNLTYPNVNPYSSSYGKFEENYLWKMNRVIEARYGVPGGLPRDLRPRVDGPEPARWMRHCFGPFELAGTSFRIHRGGGFWCADPAKRGELALVDTPAPVSDVRTEDPIDALAGTLDLALGPAPGRMEAVAEVGGSRIWAIALERTAPGAAPVLMIGPDGSAQEVPLPPEAPAARVRIAGSLESGLRIEVAGRTVELPGTRDAAVLRLAATRGSGARFGLAGLRGD
jgi:hypothetical protein